MTQDGGLLGLARSAARSAASVLLEKQRAGFDVRWKGPGDPVTDADLLADSAIRRALLASGIPVLSEEGPSDQRALPGPYWLVDPLDGTMSYVEGRPDFTVHVALVVGGRPVIGVVHHPVSGKAWAGEDGCPSTKSEKEGGPDSTIRPDWPDRLVLAVSPGQKGSRLDRLLEGLGPHGVVWRKGAGLKAMAVADGEASAYLAMPKRLGPWDVAASECILRGAGATVTDLKGAALDYRSLASATAGGFLAAGPRAHAHIVLAAKRSAGS